MGQFIYAFVFSAVMAGNAVSTSSVVLSVIDWIATGWLFISGSILCLNYFRNRDIIEINFYDED